MKQISELKQQIADTSFDTLLQEIYLDASQIPYQKKRYENALLTYEKHFGDTPAEIYSAPGRSEIGGNHTDHQHGKVLAASVNLDAIAIAGPIEESCVKIISDGYDLITISLSELSKDKDEEGTTKALIKGVLAGFFERGYLVGGFQAYITSDVLIGAGLSSSAAFETIIGTILSGLYNDMKISPTDIAIIGQYAENEFFGKPCGLMDQMACSVGSLVYIDFAEPAKPVVKKIALDLDQVDYSLCIVDTKGSHADLTGDYAAIPAEMKQIARFFGKEVLRDVTVEDILSSMEDLRKTAGDRAVLRALHFIEENKRVTKEADALEQGNFETFLSLIKESGASSFQFLQNVYSPQTLSVQNVSLALAISDITLQNKGGVCRVHGGGFAGTIQAFVKNELLDSYQNTIEQVFGKGSCHILKIRKYGGIKVK